MGLLESVYSYVFGDGDPNGDLDERMVRFSAKVIRENGGAVTAEQLAPFLAPTPEQLQMKDGNIVDESWMLPILMRLNGRPEVTDDGDIVYVFDDMQVSGQGDDDSLALSQLDEQSEFLQERELEFSAAPQSNLFAAGALGVVNLGGVAYLGYLFASLRPGVQFVGFMAGVKAAYPLLALYAVAFNVAPIVRKAGMAAENEKISKRNQVRPFCAFALLLLSTPL